MGEAKTQVHPKGKLLVEILTTEDKLRLMEESRKKEQKKNKDKEKNTK